MENKLEIAARLHQSCFEKSNEEGCIDGYLNGKWGQSYKSFILGAQWQLENMWIPVEEELPEEGIENPKLGQKLPCLILQDDFIYQTNRVYDDLGDEDFKYTWFWEDDEDPVMWMPIPKFKKGE